MIGKIISGLKKEGASLESQIQWYEGKANEAEAQQNWDSAVVYRALAYAASQQRSDEAHTGDSDEPQAG